MPSLKDLRNRIRSVQNTQQITKTMKMVAAAKVRRARMRCEESRPYAVKLSGVLANLAQNTDKTGGPLLLSGRETVKTSRILVFGSDRGLCGGFNANLVKRAEDVIADHLERGRKVELVTIGRKSRDQLRVNHRDKIVKSYTDMGKEIIFEQAREIAQETCDAFESGQCDEVHILFNEFVSMMTQEPLLEQLIPFKANILADHEEVGPSGVEFEPSEEAIITELLPLNLSVQVFRAILESAASEQAARMTAMDNATRNAGEMISSLKLEYNRSRQAAITTELTEIVAGAEAIN